MFKDEKEGKLRNIRIVNLNIMKQRMNFFAWLQKYRIRNCKTKRFINLTLLTETCMNVEEYGGRGEALIPLVAVVYKYQTNTKSAGGNGYGQPQAVAEGCDVAIPCHVGVVG